MSERDDEILAFDPFSGDETEARTISNWMVVTRKPHECANCLDTIPIGARVRSMKQAFDGEIQTFRWCVACCDAIVAERAWLEGDREDEDELPPFERRASIGAAARAAGEAPRV